MSSVLSWREEFGSVGGRDLFGIGFRSLFFEDGQPSIQNMSTTLSNGYLGSRNDEERSEMRYVMRIAEFSESSNL